ncbi:MAG TPA: polysaccharide deacetylase family protein, partial [Sphingobacteriaceae bacterium]
MMLFSSRYFLSFLLSHLLILTGVVRRAKKKALSGECILSIYLHDPSRSEFESCVKWLLKNKFQPISTSQLEALSSGVKPFPKGGVIITVDDGWRSNETNIVEIAHKYKVPVTIFVATEPVEQGTFWWSYIRDAGKKKILKEVPNEERMAVISDLKARQQPQRDAMTKDQIRRISGFENITIGGHTHTHPILPNC